MEKRFSRLLALLMAVMLLTACTGNNAENDKKVEENPVKSDADVIVIGAGFSGMNASLAAAEAGAKVMLIEKTGGMGGSIRYAGGTMSGAGTKMQEAAGIKDTPDDFYNDIGHLSNGINIPELTRKHVENSAAAVDWMDSLGADFGDRVPQLDMYNKDIGFLRIARQHNVKGGGKAMAEIVEKVVQEQVKAGKINLMLNTEVADILMDGPAVVGVKLTDGTEYHAKSVILATGGYGHNEEWLHRYNFENVLTDAPDFVTGDGYNFAEKAGAIFSNMDYLPAYPGGVPVSETGFVHSVTANTSAYPGVIWITTEGKRGLNEFKNLEIEKKRFWAAVPHNLVYILMSQNTRDTQESVFSAGFKKDDNWERFDAELAKGEVVFKADSLAELAGKIGVPADALAATVEAYNNGIETGKDEFGRTDERQPFTDGPFYAIKTCPYVMLTKGGPLMNDQAQVLNKEKQPIPGLFQCGELEGGANIGGAANVGGMANTSCIIWGKIAGKSAAGYALNSK